jgi:hypothetical protein
LRKAPKIQPSVHQNHPWDHQQAMVAMILSATWQLQIRAAVTVFPAVAPFLAVVTDAARSCVAAAHMPVGDVLAWS